MQPETKDVGTFAPWRRNGDFIEAAAPLAGGAPTRYRIRERTEPRHSWREPDTRMARERFENWAPALVDAYLRDPVEINWDGVAELARKARQNPRGHSAEQFSKLVPYLFAKRLSPEEVEQAPGLNWGALAEMARYQQGEIVDGDGKRVVVDRWTAFVTEARRQPVLLRPTRPVGPEPKIVMWDALPPEERLRLRKLEYECPWREYQVSIPALPPAGDLTSDQRELEALMAEPPNGENHGRTVGLADAGSGDRVVVGLATEAAQTREFLISGGWHLEIPPPTGNRPGRRRVEVPDELRDDLLEYVGPVDLVRELTKPGGRRSETETAERLALARRVAAVVHGGAGSQDGRRVVRVLTEVYGVHRSTIYALRDLGGFTPTVTPKTKGRPKIPVRDTSIAEEFHSDSNP